MGSRRIEVEIIGDARGFGRAAAEAESKASKLGASLKRIAAAGAIVGTAFAAETIRRSINAASDLNEQIAKSGEVFGKSAAEVQKWSRQAVNSFGMSQRQALEATGTFGNMLVPMGFARDEAAQMSKKFVGLAADMASFNNASPEETLDALRAGLAGESEPLRRFGVFLNEARVEQEAMNLGLTDGKKALTEAQKAQARYSLILKDSKDAQGDFARTSDSVANSQRIAKASIEQSLAVLGNGLLPIVAKALQGFSSFVQAAGVWIPSALQRMRQVTEAVVNWYRANVASTFQAAAHRVRQVWGAVGGYVMAFTRVFLTTVVGVARGLLNVVVGVFKVVGALIRGDWSAMWNAVKQVASGALRAVVSLIRGAVGMTLAAAKAVGQAIWKGVKEGAKKLVELAGELIRMIGDAIKDAAEKALTLAKEIGKAIGRGVVDGVKSMAGAIGDAVTGIVTGPLGKVKGLLGINSPSKWVAENIGAPIGQGVTMGIDGERRNVGASFSRLAGSVMGIAAPTVGAGGVPRGVGSGGGGVTMHIHEAQRMDPQELARYTSWQYRRVMAGGVA